MEFFKTLNIRYKRALAAAAGGIAGYAYYYYIGCMSGSCPITGNPYIATGYGMVVGYLLINKPKNDTKDARNGIIDSPTDQKI